MARLEISLLGCFRVSVNGKTITTFESDKARALLAYLVVESERPHRRESLAALFWPDHPEVMARNNLRQTLYRLQRAISNEESSPLHLLVSPQDIQFNRASDHWLDTAQFMDLLIACESHHPKGLSLCGSCVEHLQKAISLYRGDFLTGFSTFGSQHFEWWLLSQQEMFHHRTLEVLSCLEYYFESRFDYAQASLYAKRALELEPWQETMHCRLMRLLALNGQRCAALHQYQTCQHILATEFRVEPSSETTRLYDQIRSGEPVNIGELTPAL